MIEVSELSKEFKLPKKYEGLGGAVKSFFSREYTIKHAVSNLSFSLENDETLGFIGINGAGKSTTIKVLTGLMKPTSGKCVVNGLVPYESRELYTRNIGVVFGNRSQLWWDLPVSESFSVLKKIYEIPDDRYTANLSYLKEVLELEEFYLTPVRNLSLGQRMRADIAASLLHNPSVLFLDEPTIGLDILVKEKIRKALKYINLTFHTTIFLTTHDLDDIEEICEKIIVIDSGKKIFDGKIGELKQRFGDERSLIVEKSEDSLFKFDPALLPYEDAIRQKRMEDGKLQLSFKNSEVNLPELMRFIVANHNIKDLSIKDSQLEDIIKGIYNTK